MYQAAPAVMMIRPFSFGYNAETAGTNSFQVFDVEANGKIVQENALKEFNAFVESLITHNIEVVVFDDTPTPFTPDSVFPNNWISFHQDGTVVLYPMYAQNRRLERRPDLLLKLQKENDFDVRKIIDISYHETSDTYLEGTGSVVFDYMHKIAYASISPRTNKSLFLNTCKTLGFEPFIFHAVDSSKQPIYHTNVVMCIGEKFAVVCFDCIPDKEEKEKLMGKLEATGHAIIGISFDQLKNFAGNMMEVESKSGKRCLMMSATAYNSLNEVQIEKIKLYTTPVPVNIDTIERYGGGSVRCMLAGIFLPKISVDPK